MSSKELKWYKRKPFKATLCWVSNTNKNPTKGHPMKTITNYHNRSRYPFRLGGGQGWKYAIPLTEEEIVKYTVNTIKYVHYLESAVSTLLKDKIETGSEERPTKWYKRIPFEPALCWVSCENNNPADEGIIRLIAEYDKDLYLSFRAFQEAGYRYATRLTEEELLEFITKKHKNEQ